MLSTTIDVVCADPAARILPFLSLLLVQVLHWRPFSLLTHAGVSMLLGIGLNLAFFLATLAIGSPQVISIVASPAAHDWMYLGLLPPIIFEAGFSMRKRGFFDNLTPILLYAVAGTLIATFSAGAMLYSLVAWGLLPDGLSLGHCLLFASLISPTGECHSRASCLKLTLSSWHAAY